ncbi:MAG: hypothetical protein JWN01_1056 [Patescibacteria group bacterium]|nr:hypothetical protein [Patescibacteria group bacterium]
MLQISTPAEGTVLLCASRRPQPGRKAVNPRREIRKRLPGHNRCAANRWLLSRRGQGTYLVRPGQAIPQEGHHLLIWEDGSGSEEVYCWRREILSTTSFTEGELRSLIRDGALLDWRGTTVQIVDLQKDDTAHLFASVVSTSGRRGAMALNYGDWHGEIPLLWLHRDSSKAIVWDDA